MNGEDRAVEFGPIYLPTLQRIRDLWLDLEPLVDDTAYDDVVAPRNYRSVSAMGWATQRRSARYPVERTEDVFVPLRR